MVCLLLKARTSRRVSLIRSLLAVIITVKCLNVKLVHLIMHGVLVLPWPDSWNRHSADSLPELYTTVL